MDANMRTTYNIYDNAISFQHHEDEYVLYFAEDVNTASDNIIINGLFNGEPTITIATTELVRNGILRTHTMSQVLVPINKLITKFIFEFIPNGCNNDTSIEGLLHSNLFNSK